MKVMTVGTPRGLDGLLRQPLPGSGANVVGAISPDDLRKTIPRRSV